jgi:hypothetical protein
VSTTSEAWIVSLESLAGALSYCVKILSAIPLLSLHETEFELTYFVHCKSLNVKVEQCTVLQKSQIVLPKETRIDDKWSQAQPPAGWWRGYLLAAYAWRRRRCHCGRPSSGKPCHALHTRAGGAGLVVHRNGDLPNDL